MRTIIIGNGIDIQYGGKDYFSCAIIERAINNVKTGNFRSVDYPISILSHLDALYDLALKIIEDKNLIISRVWEEDRCVLDNFCLRYGNKEGISKTQIGFEDYFFLQKIYFNITYDPDLGNANERIVFYDYLRRFFLDAIYNQGKICKIEYPIGLGEFLSEFDNIFSLNYDRNLEKITKKEVHYLHGAFHIIHEKYNNDSQMNKALGIITDIKGYEYLYSTALTTYSGKEKKDTLLQADDINNLLKFSTIFKMESERSGIDIHPSVKRIIEAKELSPRYEYPQKYCYDLFKEITDEVVLLGLSPSNDDHLIEIIRSNTSKIVYYYYPSSNSDSEKELVSLLFGNKSIVFKNVKRLWDSFQI